MTGFIIWAVVGAILILKHSDQIVNRGIVFS